MHGESRVALASFQREYGPKSPFSCATFLCAVILIGEVNELTIIGIDDVDGSISQQPIIRAPRMRKSWNAGPVIMLRMVVRSAVGPV